MKTITVCGNVGKDSVLRRTQSGDTILGFSVAVEDRTGSEKRTLWFDVSVFGKRGETLSQFITKGTKVAVSGDFSTREYDSKTYLTVRAAEVTLMGGGQDRGEPRQERQQSTGGAPAGGLDDDIPFNAWVL